MKNIKQSLQNEKHELLTAKVLKRLAQNRILATVNFLEEDEDKLIVITGLSLAEILCIKNNLFMKYSATVVNGVSLLMQDLSVPYLSTGISKLDFLLGGGLPKGCITELCGLAGSGKTQLSLQIAVNCVTTAENTVLYIDTKGDFSAIRLQKLLENLKFSHKEMASIMYKIRVVYIWTMDEILELFSRLKNKQPVIENLSLIIIDSVPSLMFQYLGDISKTGLMLLNSLVNYIRFLGKEQQVCTVCINIYTRWIDQGTTDTAEDLEYEGPSTSNSHKEKCNRCLGKYWEQIPSVILSLTKTQNKVAIDNATEIDITVIKSSITNLNLKSCCVQICAKGVV